MQLDCFERLILRFERALLCAVDHSGKGLVFWCVIPPWHLYTKLTSPDIVYTYMGTSQNDDDKKPVPPDQSTVVLLLGDIGDTTWRMFVPTVGLTVLGLLVDKWFHTTPWIMSAGIVIGAAIAYLLVRRQIKKVKQDDK